MHMASATREKPSHNPEADPIPLPNGPAAAAILAGGIGSAWYGLLVVLAESVKSIGKLLTFYKPVGNLTGKTIIGVAGFLLSWFILNSLWKGKDVKVDQVWTAALVLIVVGLILTFPPVFLFIAGE